MSNKIEVKVQGTPRTELIDTAVNFLQNPNVQKSSTFQKEAFLRKKGLTTEEIKIAFEKSVNLVPLSLVNYDQNVAKKGFWFQKIKDVISTATLVVGASYTLYYLYKKFIKPVFPVEWNISKKQDRNGSTKKPLEKAITELKEDIQRIQAELEQIVASQREQNNYKLMSELKSDITTVKGILLSRHQYSSVSLSGPAIPNWQLTGESTKHSKEGLENEDNEHNSGSSETEIVVNTNSNGGSQGSDSSLEMIKEVDN
ncbi:conserved hypothetical protein [Pediculus humanus corporis]|uniref:Peroxisomal membrane protein PEX14 n=1 Tax=Pediculus humanus subsp. corporis TaxID=121224 RepID=E0VVR6_PEDHC|nr:uncharacterized protein Phum_PHUM467180 [Pediculus humanus corporis]EEB17472.1 conserved hypothetical protein [Pediculus humanus corporis]